jgi:hypothetical protein
MTDAAASLPPQFEGILHAHRRLIAAVLAAAAEQDPGLLDRIEEQAGYRDAHEDPGAEPDLAFALEAAADAELKRLLAAARREMRLRT